MAMGLFDHRLLHAAGAFDDASGQGATNGSGGTDHPEEGAH